MTLKQLIQETKRTNKFLEEIGVAKEYRIFINEENGYIKRYSSKWLKEYIPEIQNLILTTQILNNTIVINYDSLIIRFDVIVA